MIGIFTIVAYLAIGAVIGKILNAYNVVDEDETALAALLWPLSLGLIVSLGALNLFMRIIRRAPDKRESK